MKSNRKKVPSAVFQGEDDRSAFIKDIKRLSIAELIEHYAFAEAVVETVREPLVVLDQKLHIKSANRAFFRTFKLSKDEVYGKFIYAVNGGEWNIPELRKLLENILPNSSFFVDFEVRHDFERIGRKIMLLNARRVALEENKTELILLAIEDVTERKALEEQKDEFMSIASHELKTPLTTIKVYAQLLEKKLVKSKDSKNQDFLSHILKQSDKITALIGDLLDANRIDSGKMVLDKKAVNMKALIQGVIADIRNTTDKHEILLEGDVQKRPIADKDRIEQVIENLLTNAVKYSPGGGQVIVRLSEDSKNVVVAIQDHGIGISQEQQQYLFSKYFRVKESGKSSKGFGLGLYISGQIIERHGGRIWVESGLGKGSTIYFSLPLLSRKT